MIAQRCPKCESSRVRRGYTDTALLLRLVGVYRLLCDNCNLQFVGLAVPGTVPPRGSHRRRKRVSHSHGHNRHQRDGGAHGSKAGKG
ncbi:MAG TPA: hypothetical protein VD968_11180 [Pyrinomonadaceae bacterium]|nr:hypothetical protein [Pyrinomonadaceae bacterium]